MHHIFNMQIIVQVLLRNICIVVPSIYIYALIWLIYLYILHTVSILVNNTKYN